MKHLLRAALLVAALATPALAQETAATKIYKVELTGAELDYLYAALVKAPLPYEQTQVIIQKIQLQYAQQSSAPVGVAKPPPSPAPAEAPSAPASPPAPDVPAAAQDAH